MAHLSTKNAAAPVDYASIARVASAVELRDISLRSSRTTLNVGSAEIPERWSGEAFVGFDTTLAEHDPASKNFTINAGFIAVYKASWGDQVHAELPVIDPKDPPEIEIRATFELTYNASGGADLDPDDLENFAVANGTLHAWPYWREFADSITTRMHVPRLVVGVFKIPSRHDPGGRDEPAVDPGEGAKSPADGDTESVEKSDGGED